MPRATKATTHAAAAAAAATIATATTPKAPRKLPPWAALVSLVATLVLLQVYTGFHLVSLQEQHAQQQQAQQVQGRPLQSQQQQQAHQSQSQSLSIGRRIVQRAYDRTYKILETSCQLQDGQETLRECMTRIHEELILNGSHHESNNPKANATSNDGTPAKSSQLASSSFPWWFRTLLRDGATRPNVHANFHYSITAQPALETCSIEKNGSNEWRTIACLLNQNTTFRGSACNRQLPAFFKKQQSQIHFDKLVVLRDPLARILSGFIDKCYKGDELYKIPPGHCEPAPLYGAAKADTATQEAYVTLLRQDKQFFLETWLQTHPLRWDIHFYPQALYCRGLFHTRIWQTYQHVLYMNETYREQLLHVRDYYNTTTSRTSTGAADGTKNRQLVASAANNNNNNNNNNNLYTHGHDFSTLLDRFLISGTKVRNASATSKLTEFYNARAVKQALEYMSIDYVKLGFEIPTWAEDLLEQEYGNNNNNDFDIDVDIDLDW